MSNNRQIVLDTETTGIGAETGHRIIEIGCVELIERKITGDSFHTYLNPGREVEEGAFRVHGISTEFLQDKPLFKDVAQSFLHYIEDAELIIHNAPFDVGFLNSELKRLGLQKTIQDHARIFDTLDFARKKHPGQRNSLDALCKRYEVDLSKRQWHGALLDAELLAYVYLAMTGGQANLFVDETVTEPQLQVVPAHAHDALKSQSPVLKASEEEALRHAEFILFLTEKSKINHWIDQK